VRAQITERHDRWLAWSRDRFGVLLALVVLNYVVLMLLPGDRAAALAGFVIVGATTLFALDAAAAPRRVRIVARLVLLLLPVLPLIFVLGRVDVVGPMVPISLGLMMAVTVVVIIRHLLGHITISGATLLAAVDAYVLIGLVFAQLFYGFSKLAIAAPFLAQPVHPIRPDFIYLSFVVLTTLGFGDLTPHTEVARTLVITEALVGQIFLVTAVARVVSLYGTTRREERPGAPEE
jgi:Ion channel